MMHYPALNRSRCCKQSICTDCYLQVRARCNNQPRKAKAHAQALTHDTAFRRFAL